MKLPDLTARLIVISEQLSVIYGTKRQRNEGVNELRVQRRRVKSNGIKIGRF